MTVVAFLRDGTEATIAQRHGATVDAVVASLNTDSLTGSALQDAELETADGRMVRYSDVNGFRETDAF